MMQSGEAMRTRLESSKVPLSSSFLFFCNKPMPSRLQILIHQCSQTDEQSYRCYFIVYCTKVFSLLRQNNQNALYS